MKYRSVIIVLLLASIVPVRPKMKEKSSPKKKSYCQMSRKNRENLQALNGRTSYVKAILAEPEILATQHLAKQFADNELKSPNMQQMIKKLSTIHHSKTKANEDENKSLMTFIPDVIAIDSKKKRTYKMSRFKGPRKRIKKKLRCRHAESLRFARQVANPATTYGRKKSNEPRFRNNPYESLGAEINYPEIEDFEDINEGSFSDEGNDLKMRNKIDRKMSNLMENGQEFVSNEYPDHYNIEKNFESQYYPYYNENLNNVDSDYEERSIPRRSKLFSLSPFPRYHHHHQYRNNPRIENIEQSFDKMSNFRSYVGDDDDDDDDGISLKKVGGAVSPFYSKHESGAMYSRVAHEKRNVSTSQRSRKVSTKSANVPSTGVAENKSTGPPHLGTNGTMKTRNNFSTTISLNNSTASPNGSATRFDNNMTTSLINNTISSFNNWTISGAKATSSTLLATETKIGLSKYRKVKKSFFENIENGTTTKINADGSKRIDESATVAASGASDKTARLTTIKPEKWPIERPDESSSTIINETKRVAGQILNTIIQEFRNDFRNDTNNDSYKEGLPCKLSGSWTTTKAGVRIDMLVTNRGVNISMAKLYLPVGIYREALLNYTWNITGYAPFRRGGPFSLVATDNHTKSLAVFVGACKVCQGVDTIQGVWSLAREPRDCRDFQMSTNIYNDIFRRTHLYSALKDKQSIISNNKTMPDKTQTNEFLNFNIESSDIL